MLSPNDRGPFKPADHNILAEDKRASILKASATPPLPPPFLFYLLTIQEVLTLSLCLTQTRLQPAPRALSTGDDLWKI